MDTFDEVAKAASEAKKRVRRDQTDARRQNSQKEADEARAKRNTRRSGSSVKQASSIYAGPGKPILRTSKIKTIQQVSASSNHIQRVDYEKTLNADPAKAHLNETLVGSGDLVADVRKRIGDRTVRKNAVVCIEVLLTASPQYFRPKHPDRAGTYNQTRLDKWKRESLRYLRKTFGDNLVSVVLHLDETSPHFHAHLVAVDFSKNPKGNLNAGMYLNGKEKMSGLQTGYHRFLYQNGIKLERGEIGSKAKHKSIRNYYGEVTAPLPKQKAYEVEKATVGARLSPEKYAQEEVDKALQQQRQNLNIAVKKARRFDQAASRRDDAVRSAESFRMMADRVRDLDLIDVVEALGATRDPQDKHKYKINGSSISINGDKFFDQSLQSGGGGAIDLVMHVNTTTLRQAVQWLSSEFGEQRALAATTAKAERDTKAIVKAPRTLMLPVRSKEQVHIDKMRDYLINERKLDAHLVEQLIARGDVYPAVKVGKNGRTFVNVVALSRGRNKQPGGAEIVGISGVKWKGLAKGSNKKLSVFSVGPKQPQRVVFVSSMIDAVSYHQLNQTHKAVSVAGEASPERIRELVSRYIHEVESVDNAFALGFDDDDVGRAAAEKIPEFEHLKLGHGCKDWNDLVKHLATRTESGVGLDAKTPSDALSVNQKGSEHHARKETGYKKTF